jgi:hypothetical protein
MGKRGVVAASAFVAAASLSSAQAAQSPVTLDVSPRVWGATGLNSADPLDMRGQVVGGADGDVVRITARECGLPAFRLLFDTHVERNGAFSGHAGAPIRTEFRAEWKGHFSAPVTVRSRPSVRLRQLSRQRFHVDVVALRYFRQARIELQRFTGGRWVTVRRARLTRSFPAGQVLWTTGDVVARVSRGTNVRAVLPRSETGACYIAGVSGIVRASG